MAGGRVRPARGGTQAVVWDVCMGVKIGVVQGVPIAEVHGDVALEMHLGIDAGVGGRRFILFNFDRKIMNPVRYLIKNKIERHNIVNTFLFQRHKSQERNSLIIIVHMKRCVKVCYVMST